MAQITVDSQGIGIVTDTVTFPFIAKVSGGAYALIDSHTFYITEELIPTLLSIILAVKGIASPKRTWKKSPVLKIYLQLPILLRLLIRRRLTVLMSTLLAELISESE